MRLARVSFIASPHSLIMARMSKWVNNVYYASGAIDLLDYFLLWMMMVHCRIIWRSGTANGRLAANWLIAWLEKYPYCSRTSYPMVDWLIDWLDWFSPHICTGRWTIWLIDWLVRLVSVWIGTGRIIWWILFFFLTEYYGKGSQILHSAGPCLGIGHLTDNRRRGDTSRDGAIEIWATQWQCDASLWETHRQSPASQHDIPLTIIAQTRHLQHHGEEYSTEEGASRLGPLEHADWLAVAVHFNPVSEDRTLI